MWLLDYVGMLQLQIPPVYISILAAPGESVPTAERLVIGVDAIAAVVAVRLTRLLSSALDARADSSAF